MYTGYLHLHTICIMKCLLYTNRNLCCFLGNHKNKNIITPQHYLYIVSLFHRNISIKKNCSNKHLCYTVLVYGSRTEQDTMGWHTAFIPLSVFHGRGIKKNIITSNISLLTLYIRKYNFVS